MRRLPFVIWWLAIAIMLGPWPAVAMWLSWRVVRWALRRRGRRTYTRPPAPEIDLPAGYDRVRESIDRRTKQLVLARDGHRCQNPNCRTRQGPFHIDHIFPVSRGGTNRLVNLQTLCVPCNLAKGAKVPHWSLVPKGEPIHYTAAELAALEALAS